MASGDLVIASNYNAIRKKIISIIGEGYHQRGYGQQIYSSEVAPGHLITADVWNELRIDLLNIKLHQLGNTGTHLDIISSAVSQVIKFGAAYPVTNYDTLIEESIVSRFISGADRTIIHARETTTYSGPWEDIAQCISTVQFDTVDKARYFFNSGGKIRFYSSFSPATATAQNTALSSLLDTIGMVQFGAATPTNTTYYELTDVYQPVYQSPSSGLYSYSSGQYQILAKCDVADNQLGTARMITFKIVWIHEFSGGVDGTLLLSIDELKDNGNLFPTGAFSIDSPMYTLSNITAT